MNPKLAFLFERRSIRHYTDRAVPETMVSDLLEAAMAAPAAVAKDPWEFVVVRQPETLRAIAAALPNGKMLAKAPLGFVVCGDLERAHGNELSYLLQDCSAATENLLLAASALGLGACWLGVHPREKRIEHIRELFQLPPNVLPIAAVAVGFPDENTNPRTRYDDTKVHRETW